MFNNGGEQKDGNQTSGVINYGLDKTKMTKAERRKLAKKMKKERLVGEGKIHRKRNKSKIKAKTKNPSIEGKQKKKMTKEERKVKYTALAREQRDKKRMQQMNAPGSKKKVICFGCRKWGHSLALCPNVTASSATEVAKDTAAQENMAKRKRQSGEGNQLICYNCGALTHALRNCKSKIVDGGMRFATCFLCKKQGHLSASCPDNQHGIYPKGGQCKMCGSKAHLVSQCPEKSQKDEDETKKLDTRNSKHEQRENFSVKQFGGGDDLEDDFEFIKDSEIRDCQDDMAPSRAVAKNKGRTVDF